MTHDVARSIIVKDSEAHFDRDLVETLLECEPRFREASLRFSDAVLMAA
jgi:response regulator RpfG family c-di-GMP phosphodiesterase